MTSITKNIYNNPNTSRRFKPADKSKYYIYKFELFSKSAIAFSKVAGGVGDKIFQYLDWKKEMNGRQFETLPESVFYGQWGITVMVDWGMDRHMQPNLLRFRLLNPGWLM